MRPRSKGRGFFCLSGRLEKLAGGRRLRLYDGVSEGTSISSGSHVALSDLARSVDLRNRAQFLRMIANDCIGEERACLIGVAMRFEIMAENSQGHTRRQQATG
jgi:hypothetical protein